MNENQISHAIIGKAIEVHKAFGPGLLESVYQECLFYDLKQEGFNVEKEKPMPVIYKELIMEHGYRIDLLINEKVVIEIKSVDSILDVHVAQMLTYLKLGEFKLGLLINFNVPILKDGIQRYVNNL